MAEEQTKSLYMQLKEAAEREQKATFEKNKLIEKSLASPTSPKDVVYATKLLQDKNSSNGIKAYFVDPLAPTSLNGYEAKPYQNLSFQTLRSMARQTSLISAIITTRKEQVSSYSSYSYEDQIPGWKIEKNITNYFKDVDVEEAKSLTQEDKKEILKVISFIENCGFGKNHFDRDDFNTFLRKFVEDSLTIDQACFEIVPSELSTPYEFRMVDGATIRYASLDFKKEQEEINGFYPTSVQLYQNSIYTYFYPWEMAMNIRNKATNYSLNGYGISELELLVRIVTYTLYAETYNGKFFSQGSSPRGLFLAKDNLSEDKLQEFRQTWQSQISGLAGSHKIPIVSGADIQYVDLQKSNTDMEFSNWIEYLTRLTCTIFKIDPKELGYNFSSDNSVNYESSIQEKINYSKEKGLVPLLRFIEDKINKFVVGPLTKNKYRFRFTGIDNSYSLVEQNDLAKVEKGVMSFGEYRAKRGLPTSIAENDFLLNSNWIQYKQMVSQQQQQQQMAQQQQMMQQMGQGSPMGGEQQEQEQAPEHNLFKDFVEENPFARDLDKFVKKTYPNVNRD